MTGVPDCAFPADPYPGTVPPWSFAHLDGHAHLLSPTPWRIADTRLDDWLGRHDAPPVRERVPVLAYGSNRCPGKITWLRSDLGLGDDPVVVLRCTTVGVAAVWAAGVRARDGQRPAVLVAAPGVVEEHALWLATREQVAVLDRCEGRDDRFRLARLPGAEVRTEDGCVVDRPWVYLGHGAIRRPLLVAGVPVRCTDLPQQRARDLVGVPAPGDGLEATTVVGEPEPADWTPPSSWTV